ncbi:hypothetical protein AAY473_029334 [Plecturocebus cupreus]
MKFFCFLVFLWRTPLPHRARPSWVRCACYETLGPQRFQLLFSLWGWDQPSPSVLYTPHREALHWGTGKTAGLAKRVVLATRVSPLPGISRSVGNKNSSENTVKQMKRQDTDEEKYLQIAHLIKDLYPGSGLALSPKLECSGTTEARYTHGSVVVLLHPPNFEPRAVAGFRGTVRYASINAHRNRVDREIPGRGDTRVASATLLAGAAVVPSPSAALPGAEYTGQTGLAGPIPTRKTAIGSAED